MHGMVMSIGKPNSNLLGPTFVIVNSMIDFELSLMTLLNRKSFSLGWGHK